MFGKKKSSKLLQPDGANRLEANQWAADEVAVARLLRNARPQQAHMSSAARQALRQRLIDQHNRQLNPFHHALRYAMITATVAVVAGLL
ncbi:MAG: hypothetical protein U0175_12895 [Caldilineaceae bacterium]